MSECGDTPSTARDGAGQATEAVPAQTQSEGLEDRPYGSPSDAPDTGDATLPAADLESGAVDQTEGKNPDEEAAGPAEEQDPGTDLPVNTAAVE